MAFISEDIMEIIKKRIANNVEQDWTMTLNNMFDVKSI